MALQKLNAQTLEGDLDVVDITASGDITLTSTASFKIPSGTTAQRGTSTTGALRFNSQTSGFEGYNGSEWGTIGGGGLIDDDEDTYITAEATPDSDVLDFWTAGTKRMTIANYGAVGIGTISPNSLLDVRGTVQVGTAGDGHDVKFWSNNSNDAYWAWDAEEDAMMIVGDCEMEGDFDLDGKLLVGDGGGSATNSYDVKFYGDTTGKYMLWDENQNKLVVSGDITVTGTVAGVTATHVGLGNVDNTTDANKPVSTATQTALNLKAPLAAPAFTGTATGVNLTLSGDLTVNGTTTTLDTTLESVDKLEVGANSTDYGAKINQVGTGDILQLQDSGTDVFVVEDGGNVGIGTSSPATILHITGTDSLVLPVGTTAQRGTATQGAFRYNTTTPGFEGYDGSAWGAISGAENAYTKQTFTATVNQTIFTLANAYTLGYIDVYLNGVKLVGGDDFTATDTSTPYRVILASGVAAGNTLQTVAFNTFVVAEDTLTTQTFTASTNQTTFTLNDAYTAGFINVYLNGIKLVVGVDVTASNGTTVVLTSGADVDDTLQTEAFGSFSVANTVPSTGGTFTGAVTLPSPVINTGVSGSAILDEDAMGSNSATKLATQQSIKAYVDASTHTPEGTAVLSTGETAGKFLRAAGDNSSSWQTVPSFDADAAQVFNDSGADVDFRIESDDNANMFFVDGGNDQIGIGTASPASALTIAGATSNLSTFTEDLTVAANYSMAIIGPVTIPNVTVNGNLNIMTELNVTGEIDTGANGSFNIIG